MLTRMACEPPPYMHSVKPSHVLSGLSIRAALRSGTCSSGNGDAGFISYQAAPPANARRRKEEEGRSKNMTAAPSRKPREARPQRETSRKNRLGEAALGGCLSPVAGASTFLTMASPLSV